MKKLFCIFAAILPLMLTDNSLSGTKHVNSFSDGIDGMFSGATAHAATAADQWTEEAVVARVREIYQRVKEEFTKDVVRLAILDSLFCAKDYKELYQKVRKIEKGKFFDKLCFIEYRPWDLGLVTPIKVTNIRPKLLTGDMAEVFFDLAETNGTATTTVGWVLYLEDGVWKVHDFLSAPGDYNGMWDRMSNYVEKHR